MGSATLRAPMFLLDNSVQPYAWGSRSFLATLQGRPSPSTEPEAELWMGAHPSAPSRAEGRSLLELIDEAPEHHLGAEVMREFGRRLPFLLKVLAADQPLSLQAHPSLEQAREGFAHEEAAGVPRNAPNRNYKDANHKPELLCALTPFEALCGFRRADQTLSLLESLGSKRLNELLAPLRRSPDGHGLRALFERLMSLLPDEREPLVEEVVAACKKAPAGPRSSELAWAVRLGAQYPGDAGVVGALLLNLVTLAPGEAIYLPAGNLHAYLQGAGIELMANSDNVLRGGLTPKHVDVAQLLRVLDFHDGPVHVLHPRAEGGEARYLTPAREFSLSRVTLAQGTPFEGRVQGPEILCCTEGACELDGRVPLRPGHAAFVSAADARFTLSGRGTVYRARLPSL